MGYEQKFYIVDKSDSIRGFGEFAEMSYANVIAMFDYSKDNDFASFVDHNSVDTDCYFYADDGNTEVVIDNCGAPLREIGIGKLIQYLEDHPSDYRRHGVFLDILKAFEKVKDRFKHLVVLRYGH